MNLLWAAALGTDGAFVERLNDCLFFFLEFQICSHVAPSLVSCREAQRECRVAHRQSPGQGEGSELQAAHLNKLTCHCSKAKPRFLTCSLGDETYLCNLEAQGGCESAFKCFIFKSTMKI